MKRSQDGRQQNETLKAAKDDRFGILKQSKTGEKTAVRQDNGLMTVSQQGEKSKFKSCFGEVKPIEKKAYVSTSTISRKKPTSYFDTVRRMETDQISGIQDQSQLL